MKAAICYTVKCYFISEFLFKKCIIILLQMRFFDVARILDVLRRWKTVFLGFVVKNYCH